MATTTGSEAASRFLLDPELMAGAIYRKYEKATRKFWDPKDFDYTQDAADWERMSPEQREGIITITVRIEAGEEAVTDELLPMLAASHELGRFDWVMFLSTFMLDEARHSEFFNIWHRRCAVSRPRPRRPRTGLCAATPSIRAGGFRSASRCTRASRSTATR